MLINKEIKNKGLPKETMQAMNYHCEQMTFLWGTGEWSGPTKLRLYGQKILDESGDGDEEMVRCGLDRNPKGMAMVSKKAYFEALEAEYCDDKKHYKVVVDCEEQQKILRTLELNDRVFRPPNIRSFARKGTVEMESLGFEYLNLKEKCCGLREDGSSGLVCTKAHSHWRTISTQGDGVPQTQVRCGSRAIGHLQRCDPAFRAESAGLNALGHELSADFQKLSGRDRYFLRCRRCKKDKRGASMIRMDVAQQFKSVRAHQVRVSLSLLSRRIKKRWGCCSVEAGHDAFGLPKYSLSKKKKAIRGETIWTFGHAEGDLERLNEWMGSLTASRLGDAMLIRVRGIPMGNSMSPVRASLCLSECERRAWTTNQYTTQEGFADSQTTVINTIAARRIADDTTMLSKELCTDCLEEFGVWCYEKQKYARGLAIEIEETGKRVTMCDRVIAIKEKDGLEYICITRFEKNREFLVGNESNPKRIRFQPGLGHVSTQRIRAWITARWFDEQEKNDLAKNIIYGQLEVLSEIVCLGFSPQTVLIVLKTISKPEWRRTAELGKRWIRLVSSRRPVEYSRAALRQLMMSWTIDMN